MSNWLPDKTRREVCDRLLRGESVRSVAKNVGVAKGTVTRYRAVISAAELFGDDMRLPHCACGQPSGHRGWCRDRFMRSPARQAVIGKWRSK